MQPWKTLSRSIAYQPENGRWLTVESHTVELPDGSQIDNWQWIKTPAFVNVVIITAEGQFLCFRQTKYAAEGITLGIVGGYLDVGEEPLAAAQREVLEETGYRAASWTSLGSYAVDGNRGSGTAHLFLAQGAYFVQAANADDLEELEIIFLTRAEAEEALHNNEFKVLPWAAAVALALATAGGV